MDEEILQELKTLNKELKLTNNKIKDMNITNDMIKQRIESIEIGSKIPLETSHGVEFNSFDFLSFNTLSLIFGFLVGYCLIKSFFDGLKV